MESQDYLFSGRRKIEAEYNPRSGESLNCCFEKGSYLLRDLHSLKAESESEAKRIEQA
jgi:hypothetical protein